MIFKDVTKLKSKYGLKPIIRIKEILEEKRMTQKELAEMMGETPQQVNKWVMGVEPCLNALGRIAITLGVQLSDLVWYKGDNADFDVHSEVYIRGEVAHQASSAATEGKKTGIPQLLQALRQYYRWTDEELSGVKVLSWDAQKGEITLGCAGEDLSEDFIIWARKDRDSMYRL